MRALRFIVCLGLACSSSQGGGSEIPPEPVPTTPPPAPPQCRATGCGSTVCSDQDVVTTCEYRPEYDCYKSAVCERGESGACGWRDTPELAKCLEEKKAGSAPPSGKTCQSSQDCDKGQACVGPEGCDKPWSCQPALGRMCTMDLAPHCGCDGKTYQSSSSCPARPYRHRGACKP